MPHGTDVAVTVTVQSWAAKAGRCARAFFLHSHAFQDSSGLSQLHGIFQTLQMSKSTNPKRQNWTSLVLLLAAPAPSLLYCIFCAARCAELDDSSICILCHLGPLTLVNALFFLNVCVIWYIVGLVQGSTWVCRCPFQQIDVSHPFQ